MPETSLDGSPAGGGGGGLIEHGRGLGAADLVVECHRVDEDHELAIVVEVTGEIRLQHLRILGEVEQTTLVCQELADRDPGAIGTTPGNQSSTVSSSDSTPSSFSCIAVATNPSLPVRNAVSVVIGVPSARSATPADPTSVWSPLRLTTTPGTPAATRASSSACSSGDTLLTSVSPSPGSDAAGSVAGGDVVAAAAETGGAAVPAMTAAPTSDPSTFIHTQFGVVGRWQRVVTETPLAAVSDCWWARPGMVPRSSAVKIPCCCAVSTTSPS